MFFEAFKDIRRKHDLLVDDQEEREGLPFQRREDLGIERAAGLIPPPAGKQKNPRTLGVGYVPIRIKLSPKPLV